LIFNIYIIEKIRSYVKIYLKVIKKKEGGIDMNIYFFVIGISFISAYIAGGYLYDLYLLKKEINGSVRHEDTTKVAIMLKRGKSRLLIITLLTVAAPLVAFLSCLDISFTIESIFSAVAKIIFLIIGTATMIVIKEKLLYGGDIDEICDEKNSIMVYLPKIIFAIFVLGFLSYCGIFFLFMI